MGVSKDSFKGTALHNFTPKDLDVLSVNYVSPLEALLIKINRLQNLKINRLDFRQTGLCAGELIPNYSGPWLNQRRQKSLAKHRSKKKQA